MAALEMLMHCVDRLL